MRFHIIQKSLDALLVVQVVSPEYRVWVIGVGGPTYSVSILKQTIVSEKNLDETLRKLKETLDEFENKTALAHAQQKVCL